MSLSVQYTKHNINVSLLLKFTPLLLHIYYDISIGRLTHCQRVSYFYAAIGTAQTQISCKIRFIMCLDLRNRSLLHKYLGSVYAYK